MEKADKDLLDFYFLRRSYTLLKWITGGLIGIIVLLLLALIGAQSRPIKAPKPVVIQVDPRGNAIPLYNYEIFSSPQKREVLTYSAFIAKQLFEFSPNQETYTKKIASVVPFLAPSFARTYKKMAAGTMKKLISSFSSSDTVVRVKKVSLEGKAFPYRVKISAIRLYVSGGEITAAEKIYATLVVTSGERSYDNPWGLFVRKIENLEIVEVSPSALSKELKEMEITLEE